MLMFALVLGFDLSSACANALAEDKGSTISFLLSNQMHRPQGCFSGITTLTTEQKRIVSH